MGILRTNGSFFIVSEWVDGGNLRSYIEEHPGLSWIRRVTIARDIARAVLFLHAKAIIHR